MLTLNDLLSLEGVDPARTLLLRHTKSGVDMLSTWRANRSIVEDYQSRQRPGLFANASHAVCLIPDGAGREIFGGVYVVGGHRPETLGDFEPLSGRTPDGSGEYHVHDLTRLDDFRRYEDRLVVDWTTIGAPGPSRSWKQWAGRNPKPVVEITDQTEPPFPGFTTFAHPVDELDMLPRSWREVLRSTCGVYLLTDEAGQQYVGSAKGAEGFLGRWQSYREGRAGGNLGLASHAVGRFRVTVLRTFDPSTPDITVEAEESAWKTKLGSRERGLNRN